ncbi:MAG: helix-turn-helix domain-containing protein [Bifidobacteriaceae bacterium]|nr:helix-turn-helix domain-containing protein [Bifidobacteriaceae bacterium]
MGPSKAQRRRRFTQASIAERMGCLVSTVRRMEQGDGRVSIHFFARALQVFGQLGALEDLVDSRRWSSRGCDAFTGTGLTVLSP